jgi:hypothetical protein
MINTCVILVQKYLISNGAESTFNLGPDRLPHCGYKKGTMTIAFIHSFRDVLPMCSVFQTCQTAAASCRVGLLWKLVIYQYLSPKLQCVLQIQQINLETFTCKQKLVSGQSDHKPVLPQVVQAPSRFRPSRSGPSRSYKNSKPKLILGCEKFESLCSAALWL